MAVVIAYQSGCRIDDEGRAADNQHVGVADIVEGLFDHIVVEAFFIEDDVWFDGAAAGIAFGNAGRMEHVFGIKQFVAVFTKIAVHAAVQFQDVFTAGFLMQAVDVLGNNGF